MTKYDPSIDKVSVFGKGRHGLLQADTLTLDVDGTGYQTIPYTGTGDTLLIDAGAPPVVRTAEQQALDAENSLEWRRDCVLYDTGKLYSVDARFKGVGEDNTLYIDENKNIWLIEWLFNASTQEALVRVVNQFGKFFGLIAPSVYKTILSPDVTSIGGSGELIKEIRTYQSKTGEKVLLTMINERDPEFAKSSPCVERIVEVTISGNGFVPSSSSDFSQLGDGITATASVIKTWAECYNFEESNSVETPLDLTKNISFQGWSNGDPSTLESICEATPPEARTQAVTETIETAEGTCFDRYGEVGESKEITRRMIMACYDKTERANFFEVEYKRELPYENHFLSDFSFTYKNTVRLDNNCVRIFPRGIPGARDDEFTGQVTGTIKTESEYLEPTRYLDGEGGILSGFTEINIFVNGINKASSELFYETSRLRDELPRSSSAELEAVGGGAYQGPPYPHPEYANPEKDYQFTGVRYLKKDGVIIKSASVRPDGGFDFLYSPYRIDVTLLSNNVVGLIVDSVEEDTDEFIETEITAVSFNDSVKSTLSDPLATSGSQLAKASLNPRTEKISLVSAAGGNIVWV